MQREASSMSLAQLVQKLIPNVIGREIEKTCQGIYPLQNVRLLTFTCSAANIMPQTFVRKVKLLKAPKFDLGAILALHGNSTGGDNVGEAIGREFKEQVLESV